MLGVLKFLENTKIIVCLKDKTEKVIFQNNACIDICGVMVNSDIVCSKNCMSKCKQLSRPYDRARGVRYLHYQLIEKKYYDVIYIDDRSGLVTVLLPLEESYTADFIYFTQFDKLTPRETEVLKLMVMRRRNSDICTQLEIKKNTLKKYIMNIYQKLPEEAVLKLRTHFR